MVLCSPLQLILTCLGLPNFFTKALKNEIKNGFLIINGSEKQAAYELVEVDVDGAAIKTVNLAQNLQRDLASLQKSNYTTGLPSLRTAGISLVKRDRAQSVKDDFNRAAQLNQSQQLVYAEDLTRGDRIDIWDSITKEWHSLCDRIGSYSFEEGISSGSDQKGIIIQGIQDEGYIQMALTQKSADDKDNKANLYLHESLCRWEGWSLCVPRPGRALSGPGLSLAADQANNPITPFKLKTTFVPVKGALPRLRFGTSYRLRARAVDLAGNSLPLKTPGDAQALPISTTDFIYRRFEPVDAPALVLRQPLSEEKTPGESLERLVIRSFNDYAPADPAKDDRAEVDTTKTQEQSDRHVAPHRTSQLMAEVHGMFDNPTGGLKTDTYELVAKKEEGHFKTKQDLQPSAPSETAINEMSREQDLDFPIEPDALIAELPYFPDPLARGAAFRNLPGTQTDTTGKLNTEGNLTYNQLPNVEDRPGSVTLIPFDTANEWYKALPFRLALVEGSAAPEWNREKRTLTIALPKAEMTTIQLSSYINQEDLKLMGIWQWLQEYIDKQAEKPDPFSLEALTKQVSRLVQAAIEGNHWMLTPSKEIVLVHAVQQPLGMPNFLQLQIVERKLGETAVKFLGELKLHGKSTMKIEWIARWEEPVDLEREPEPRFLQTQAKACELPLNDLKRLVKNASNEVIGYCNSLKDSIVLAEGGQPTHVFGDTKHRIVRYKAVATSRFREYFHSPQDKPLNFCRESEEIVVNIPATARPAAPKVLYVIPTFGWERQTTTNLMMSQRQGGGVRVYLDRPWYSSGEGELLGVVFAGKDISNNEAEQERLKSNITQWVLDAIWDSRQTFPVPYQGNTPLKSYLPKAVQARTGLTLDENPNDTVLVAGHEVHYDSTRKLWYCDIQINTGDNTPESYYPFVRLALARFQPNAIKNAELSRVILADFVQLAPDRSVILTYDPYNPNQLNVTVSGLTYKAIAGINGAREEGGSTVEISIEKRRPDVEGDLGWVAYPNVPLQQKQALNDGNLLWHGQVNLPGDRKPKEYRLVIKEFETLYADNLQIVVNDTLPPAAVKTKRLVYADAIEI